MNTKVDLRLSAEGDDLTLRCANSFSDKESPKILEKHASVVASLREPSIDKAKGEGLSGFKKVQSVCGRVFGVAVNVSIPPRPQRHGGTSLMCGYPE